MITNVQGQCHMVAQQMNQFNIRSTGKLNWPSLYFKVFHMVDEDILDYISNGKIKI